MSLALGKYGPIVPGRPVLEIAPPQHPIYSLIGRVASAWAHLEHTLDLIIWDLIGVEAERVACVTAQLMGATNRYRAIESLLAQRKKPKFDNAREQITKLKQRTYDPQEDRNRIIHDPWYLFDAKAAQFRAMPPKDPRFGVCAIDVEKIETCIRTANDLADRAAKIRLEIRVGLES